MIDRFTGNDKKAFFSTLWIFVLLNIIFRDIHELYRAGMLEQMLSGTINGSQVTEVQILVGSIMIEIPLLMVVLSRVLNYSINRWANIITGIITIGSVFMNITNPDLDNLFFAAVEIMALVVIIWFAWRWTEPEFQPNQQPKVTTQEEVA